MKKYIDNFRQYQFLLSELVKKGIKLKYRRSYLGIVWPNAGAFAFHDRTDHRIRNSLMETKTEPSLYTF